MHVMTWVASGLVVGWAARRLLGMRQEFGLVGDLVTGCLGGILGGWLFHSTGVIGPDELASHVLVAVGGAATFLTALRALRHLTVATTHATDALPAPAPGELHERIGRLGEFDRRVLHSVLSRQRVARDPNQAFEAQITFGERVADHVARFGGSWTFIGLFFIVLVGWMALNQEVGRPFDPYPFILLNLVLSREQEWQRLLSLVEGQQQVLNHIERRLDALTGPGRATTDPC